jgi:hypothetical protein
MCSEEFIKLPRGDVQNDSGGGVSVQSLDDIKKFSIKGSTIV